MGRRRSAETDRFAAGVVEFLETRGEGDLLEGVSVGFDDELEEVEGEGDRYLEETCLDLGLIDLLEAMMPLSFWEGSKRGGVVWFLVVVVVSETAATIINENTYTPNPDEIFNNSPHIVDLSHEKIKKIPFFSKHQDFLQ